MSITKGALRTDVLLIADANGAERWDDTPNGEVDLRISAVYDSIWRRILNANRFYRWSRRALTSNADGKYLKSDLSLTPSANGAERFYRVLTFLVDGIPYKGPVNPIGYAQASTGHVWWEEGLYLTALPLQGTTAAEVWVNWIPQRPAGIAADADTVDFPDGYEDVLKYHAAARLLSKGGAETIAARELRDEVEEDFNSMLSDIARISTNPQVMEFNDSADSWAGE